MVSSDLSTVGLGTLARAEGRARWGKPYGWSLSCFAAGAVGDAGDSKQGEEGRLLALAQGQSRMGTRDGERRIRDGSSSYVKPHGLTSCLFLSPAGPTW